jgi:CheY-like chemotaxis protein
MKLIIRGTAKSELLFYVDAHDSHFSLPPQFEEQLYKIRHKNMQIKQKIESELKENNLTIMGTSDFHAVHFDPLPVRITVLAIDDEKHILNLMRIFLTKIGVRPITCSSVDDAIMHVQVQTPPDLILCDIMMPQKSGYEFYDWIKELGINIPFYFVTGLGKGSIRYPEVPVIHKPFKVCDLNAPVQKIIQEKS